MNNITIDRKIRLLIIVTHPMTASLLMVGQLSYLKRNSITVAVASSPGIELEITEEKEHVQVFPVSMEREISLLRDLLSLIGLVKVIRFYNPDIVNAGTPKGGLLGMIAAFICRVPDRVYTARGLRMETAGGLKRKLLRITEKTALACCTCGVCVSESLRGKCLFYRLAPARKLFVLGKGSSNGVDVSKFFPVLENTGVRTKTKERLGIPNNEPVIGFVGRFTIDKGVIDLFRVFKSLVPRIPNARLLLVGDFEDGDPVPKHWKEKIVKDTRIIRTGFCIDTPPFYEAMDVLAFPSYREGFPNVPLEAAASGKPVVGYRVTGTVDAVVDGQTGMLVPAGDTEAMTEAVLRYLSDPDLRVRHGRKGRERVEMYYDNRLVWREWLSFYQKLAKQAV